MGMPFAAAVKHPHPLVGRYFRVARNVRTRGGRVVPANWLVYTVGVPEHVPTGPGRGAWVPVRAGYRGMVEHVPLTALRDVPRSK